MSRYDKAGDSSYSRPLHNTCLPTSVMHHDLYVEITHWRTHTPGKADRIWEIPYKRFSLIYTIRA